MGAERRQFKRLPASLIARLRIRPATQTETLQMQIRNVSTGGVFISTLHPFSIGSLVEFDFRLPESTGTVHAKGVVRWAQSNGPDAGMGVEFLEVSTESREEITRYIHKRASLSLDDLEKDGKPGSE